MKMTCWRVRLYWRDERGIFEAGADAALPASTTAMEAIAEVAKMRSVELASCTIVEAALLTAPGKEWDDSESAGDRS